ncbi:MAG: DUF533 domain-containing protein [uncultured Sulfurovum sp.]|uniref:DUF533 domain-containing protein n=1 Tax=uncultured Sulfurovum sp. TaxID=269237 RepID=A0A6S6SCQ5_9BACT|nr:MAG: DUF533 domain-containing protein [uncultured Sulfurovum sp.]
MSMLGKMAMGMVVAKVTSSMMNNNSSSGGGGIGDMLGGLMGGNNNNASQGGGIGDLLSGLTGGSSQTSTTNNDNGLGGLLSAALSGQDVGTPTASQEEQARTLLKAMINAAKADGQIDAEEQAKIVEHIGEVTAEELEFVKSEMAAPLDLEGVIENASGIEAEVYLSSLSTINLDSKEEALYLDKLAKGLNISEEAADAFHEKLGVAKLYS